MKRRTSKGLKQASYEGNKKAQFKMMMSEDEKWWYGEFARARGMTTSRFVRKAILEYMENHPEVENENAA